MKKKILIIEDDIAIAEIERDNLEASGFEAEITVDGDEGLQKALTGAYNLLLVDVMLPGLDGFELCKQAREQLDIPIIMVTARTGDIDKIRGLGFGADDYVTKPFSIAELVARVKAHFAQAERLSGDKTKSKEIQFGRVRINRDGHQVFVDDREIVLTNKEYELLMYFVTRPNTVFSKEALYKQIWGQDMYGELKTVTVHVNKLREKIEHNPSEPRYIQTVWGAGYRFTP